MSIARTITVIDDQQVRVTTWTFDGAGDATGPHVHEHDYIVVPVTGGRFTVVDSDGATREMTQEAGSPYRGTAGTAHNVINSASTRAVFVEIELKQ
jgi:mannose-6-phosphate isomerase-like protein (cupin superfamily)